MLCCGGGGGGGGGADSGGGGGGGGGGGDAAEKKANAAVRRLAIHDQTPTSNVRFVFDSVVSIILEENMKRSGLG